MMLNTVFHELWSKSPQIESDLQKISQERKHTECPKFMLMWIYGILIFQGSNKSPVDLIFVLTYP